MITQSQSIWERGRTRSRFIEGLPLERYKEICPRLKIEIINPQELGYTDTPYFHDTIEELQRIWTETIIQNLYQEEPTLPLIPPIVISKDNDIIDGNHRAAAAGMHSDKIPAIIISTERDVSSIQRLVRANVLYWPHENKKFKEINEDCKNKRVQDWETYTRSISQRDVIWLEGLNRRNMLSYFLSRAIHQAENQELPFWLGAGTTRTSVPYKTIRKIIKQSPKMFNKKDSLEDTIQRTFLMMCEAEYFR